MSSVKQWLKDHQIDEVEAIVPDMTGTARGKLIPAVKYNEEVGLRLPESVFMQTVNGDYPADDIYDELMNPAEIDMVLKPDPKTIRLVPWASEPTATIIHDAFTHEGEYVDLAPRYVLRRIMDLYKKQGWQPVVAPELEFYLVKQNADADYPLSPPIGRSGRPESGRQSYSIDAINEFDPLIEAIYDYSEAQEIEIETLIHEAGTAQLEVNFLHGDPMDLADQVFVFKRTVREAALRHGIYATFMAKPMEKEPGSAMHIHQSIIDTKTGLNLFSAETGEATGYFYSYIAGLQHYLPDSMCLLAPNVNSYRRLTRHLAAPINVQWGYDNRTTGLRVPLSEPQSRRVENRVAGADANPYLAMASTLICGYLGMVNSMSPSEPLVGSAYDKPHDLPRSLEDAIRKLRTNEELLEFVGRRFALGYAGVKEAEWEGFFRVISSWEREHLLLSV